ncbi:MAG: NAD(P)/FAD-dependent oxidoreductase [bacterium]|nr:NAD(P)/FAD-dependent oxidoreductase [bacterium]
MEKPAKSKIVILGAGFAGVRVALDLAKSAPELEIILINKNAYHEFHPDFYEIAAASLPESQRKQVPRLTYESLKGSVAIPLAEIFGNTNMKIVINSVVSLDFKSQEVVLRGMKRLSYDFLVLALGSETNYFNIPDLKQFSLPLKSVDDALNIRNEIDEIFARKKEKEKINIIVGGGGFTGCELAGELVGFLRTLSKIHAHKQHEVRLSVVEASPVLINGASTSVQQAAEKRLRSLGVEIYLNSKITNVSKSTLFTDPHLVLPFDLLIWTAGVRSNSLVDRLAGVHTEKTCLIVDKSLRIIPLKNVFAVGDLAYCFDEENSTQVAATAQTAIDQAKYTAKNIDHLIKNEPLILYKPKKPKFIIPLGGKFAVGEIAGLVLEGIEAWWLKRAAALGYFASVLPTTKAFQLWSAGNKFFVSNDYEDVQ